MTALTAGPKSGQTMKVSIKPSSTEIFIDGVDGWNFDNKVDSKDVTHAGILAATTVVWKSYISTLRDASGTISFKFLNLSDAGQAALWTLFNTANTTAEIRFYQDETHYLFADCIATSFPLSAKLDGVQGEGMNVSIQLQDEDGLQLGGYGA
jgi:hypothetical protein